MSIVSKKGDDGFTDFPQQQHLANDNTRLDSKNNRIRKDHPCIECLGELDELDAFLALCEVALISNGNSHFSNIIKEARKELFIPHKQLNTEIIERYIAELEKENIINGFIRTWTKPASALLNTARTICRRCERRMAAVLSCPVEAENIPALNPKYMLPWLNRLSDLLFLLAVSEECA